MGIDVTCLVDDIDCCYECYVGDHGMLGEYCCSHIDERDRREY